MKLGYKLILSRYRLLRQGCEDNQMEMGKWRIAQELMGDECDQVAYFSSALPKPTSMTSAPCQSGAVAASNWAE